MNLPRHVVIVPDGNRRWAKKRGKPSFFGHSAGAKGTQELLKTAMELKIPYLTIWGASVSNITERSSAEVKFLLKLFEIYARKLAKRKELEKEQVRVRVLGRWEELFPESLKKALRNLIQSTAKHDKFNLTFLLAYDGRDEMQAAVSRIAARARLHRPAKRGGQASKNKNMAIDRETIKSSLWSHDLPPVDLVIRTGGEPHWSAGMMMWDVAESQLYFTPTLYPDFGPKEFKKALDYYARVERRHGR